MAVADGVVYVPVANLASQWKREGRPRQARTSAPARARCSRSTSPTGTILWDTKLSQMADGDATVVNDLVFTTTFDGYLLALARNDGAIVWKKKLPGVHERAGRDPATRSSRRRASPAARARPPRSIAFRLGANGSFTPTPSGDGHDHRRHGGRRGVFSQNCSSCHTLAAANAQRQGRAEPRRA